MGNLYAITYKYTQTQHQTHSHIETQHQTHSHVHKSCYPIQSTSSQQQDLLEDYEKILKYSNQQTQHPDTNPNDDQLINIQIKYTDQPQYQQVLLRGSWDNWEHSIQCTNTQHGTYCNLKLKKGKQYQLKWIVNDQWMVSKNLQQCLDQQGNINNIINV